jgi:hypothetical protein
MNIINRMPGSKMVLLAYQGSMEAIQNLRSYSLYYGNQADSLAYAKQLPWIYHLKSKTALDMILDTKLKNGHTTGLDGLWAGVPTVTLGGMSEMGKRCGESFAEGLDIYNGLAFSLKEYEDIAIEYATNPEKLKTWRNSLGRKRVTESLFDTKVWSVLHCMLLGVNVTCCVVLWRNDKNLFVKEFNVMIMLYIYPSVYCLFICAHSTTRRTWSKSLKVFGRSSTFQPAMEGSTMWLIFNPEVCVNENTLTYVN